MKRYEALIILHNPPSEDAVKAAVDQVSEDIGKAGGQVENVQKMDRKPFARVATKKASSGYYANVIFSAPPDQLPELRRRLAGREDVFRVTVFKSPARTALAEAAA